MDLRQPFARACRGGVVPEDNLKTVYMDQGLAILQSTSSSQWMMTERSRAGCDMNDSLLPCLRVLRSQTRWRASCRSDNLDTLVAHFAAVAYLLPEMNERPG